MKPLSVAEARRAVEGFLPSLRLWSHPEGQAALDALVAAAKREQADVDARIAWDIADKHDRAYRTEIPEREVATGIARAIESAAGVEVLDVEAVRAAAKREAFEEAARLCEAQTSDPTHVNERMIANAEADCARQIRALAAKVAP